MKFVLIVDELGVYFIILYFDGYLVVLVRLVEIEVCDFEELIIEVWLM